VLLVAAAHGVFAGAGPGARGPEPGCLSPGLQALPARIHLFRYQQQLRQWSRRRRAVRRRWV
jgi:hypothetical protein